MTNNDTPAAGKCETCEGKRWVPSDDPAPNHFTDECPDCRPAARTQGQVAKRWIVEPAHLSIKGRIERSDSDIEVVPGSDYDDLANSHARLLAANERLASALAEIRRLSLGFPFDAPDACRLIDAVASTALAAHRAGGDK